MNREIRLGVDGTELVNRLAEHVHHATEGGAADRNLDRIAGVHGFHTTNHTLGRLHRDRAYAAFSEMLLDFDGDVERLGNVVAFTGDANRVEDRGQVALFKLDVEHRSDDLHDAADAWFVLCHCFSLRAVRGAAHNFDNFLGDCRLANFVHMQRQRLNDFSGVARRGLHCRHARRIFCR